ncbi:zinc finger CCCH domain-containing protein 3 [Triplophysa dalaica]|uniref:zinc finger CCCH domain-containing protein 3 n=1 Tax=Triplophysa dalaica TaxID=1582913 RepID=UPI0024E02EC8|nr:zinc finger CCCH domain-containing protein 3 [Triplophysa dalaica]
MAEREALKREIEELQNLINDYKNTHGDVPSSSSQWDRSRGGRGHGSHFTQSYSAPPQTYEPPSSGSWRKTYSLNNKTTRATGGHVSHPYHHVSTLNQPSHPINNTSTTATATQNNTGLNRSNEKVPEKKNKSKSSAGLLQSETSQKRNTASEQRTVLISSGQQISHGHSSTCNLVDSTLSSLEKKSQPERKIKPTLKLPSSLTNPTSLSTIKQKPEIQLQFKPDPPTDALSSRTVIMPKPQNDSSLTSSDTSFQSHTSLTPTKLVQKPDSTQKCVASCHKRSQFTWVKKQEVVNVKNIPKTEAHPIETSVSPAPGSSPGTVKVRRLSGSNKRISHKPNLSLGSTKTSKYSWVSSSCSSSTAGKTNTTKQLRKPLSPKSYKVPVKITPFGFEGTKKTRSPTTLSVVSKKSKTGGASTSNVGHTSRYSWKPAGQGSTSNTTSSVPRSAHKNTAYQWVANKNGQKGEKRPVLSSSPAHSNTPTTPKSSGAFKLRSRTKIIRRFSSTTPSIERRYSPNVVTSRSRYSLRRRSHSQVRSPTSARLAQSKELVSFGRHKLRRLSLTALGNSRSGPPFPSVRSPPSHRVIKTRYKIDTRRAHTAHHSPTLSYRVKRVQSARIHLQNRLRTPSDRHWRGRSMRWIGGELYRVSANKLSRTHTICTPTTRPGEWYNPDISSTSNLAKTSATRYIASRAVQRSLAIIRQACQKKQKAKQYCMYYNRFGKCNHGEACPYIHDPDKVAVCTRFLRGTCKQTDGTCPFSHKVAKEKMPVCSYFLKGICNNSSCPYSHVYVSRKADVCKDFVRGYCPQGDKCKKKHTLVCPDFSSKGACPLGSKCKLHHRERVKRTSCNANSGPAKRARNRDVVKRSEEGRCPSAESTEADEGSSSSDPKKLPSFISLPSSPDPAENTDAPEFPPAAGPQAKGKTLHIKPRF